MKRNLWLLLAVLLLVSINLPAQNGDLPFNSQAYHLIDRIDIRGLADTTIHTDIKPYGIDFTGAILRQADSASLSPNEYNWYDR